MKASLILIISCFFYFYLDAQKPFYINIEEPDVEQISDVVQIDSFFYFIENRFLHPEEGLFSSTYCDLLVVNENGSILETFPIDKIGIKYQRIIKVENGDIYLVGNIKSDSCSSTILFSKYNLYSHSIEHLNSYAFCDSNAFMINIKYGLDTLLLVEVMFDVNGHYGKVIFKVDSLYNLTPIPLNIHPSQTISVDFSRNGYVAGSVGLYNFYDADFNYRKQRFTNESSIAYNETHVPFGSHYILQQFCQQNGFEPFQGNQIRLIDSNLHVIKRAVLYPPGDIHGEMQMGFYRSIHINNENEIWASGIFGKDPFRDWDIYVIARLDSNLNILCQQFLGSETYYYLNGIKSFDNGGAIVYGGRIREGYPHESSFTVTQDMWALRVGENCELPTTAFHDAGSLLYAVSVYPNPGINSLTFDVQGFDPAALSVEIISPEGITLFSQKDLNYEIHVTDLPAGQYFYRILHDEKLLAAGGWMKE